MFKFNIFVFIITSVFILSFNSIQIDCSAFNQKTTSNDNISSKTSNHPRSSKVNVVNSIDRQSLLRFKRNVTNDDYSIIKLNEKLQIILDNINFALNDLLTNGHSLSESDKCNLSKNKSTKLDNVMRNALRVFSEETSQKINCALSETTYSNCNDLIKSIQCGLNDTQDSMRNNFRLYANDDYLKLKAAYDKLYDKYLNVADEFKMSVKDESKIILDKLIVAIQDSRREIDKLIDTTNKYSKEILVHSIISIDYESMKKRLRELSINEQECKSTIVTNSLYSAYSKDSQNYMKGGRKLYLGSPITDTLEKISALNEKLLKNCDLNSIYDSLLNVMKDRNHLSEYEILILTGNIDEIRSKLFYKVVNKSDKIADSILTNWANSIVSDNYKESMSERDIIEILLSKYMKPLVDKAYSNDTSNAKRIIKFIEDRKSIEMKVLGFKTIFEHIKNSNHDSLIILAKLVKKTMEMKDISEENKETLNNIKNSLSSSIRNLIWNGKNCTIKNRGKQQYLFDEKDKWDLLDLDENICEYFDIREAGNSVKVIFARSIYDVYDDQRRKVKMMELPEEGNSNWILTPIFDDGQTFYEIQSDITYEYLYVDDEVYDSNGSNIFTWRPGTKKGRNSQWIIDC